MLAVEQVVAVGTNLLLDDDVARCRGGEDDGLGDVGKAACFADAELASGQEATVDIFAIMGSVTIRVPGMDDRHPGHSDSRWDSRQSLASRDGLGSGSTIW